MSECHVIFIAMAVLSSQGQTHLSAFFPRTTLSLEHLPHSCQRWHVRRAKRTVDFCMDNEKGPFGNRLLVKLRLGEESNGWREDVTFQNLKKKSVFFLWRDGQTDSLCSYNPQLSLKRFSIPTGIFSSSLTPQTKRLLGMFLLSKQPLALISF